MSWDDEKRAKVIKLYEDANPVPDNSIEIVKEIADEVGETPNGVRMVLSKAGVYVKTVQSTLGTGKKNDTIKTTKVGKADKIARLSVAIQSAGMIPDNEILDKLTGKAADYFAQVVEALVTAASNTEQDTPVNVVSTN
jgi:predicted transcriptional regulator